MKKNLLTILLLMFLTTAGVVFAHESDITDTVVIHMSNDGFNPKEVIIQRGEKVVFENVGEDEHWPASNIHPTHRAYPKSDISDCGTTNERFMFDACKPIKPNQTYTFQFDELGEWRFHDHLNATFSGQIHVVENGGAQEEKVEEKKPGILRRFWNWLKGIFSRNEVVDDIREDIIDREDEDSALLDIEYEEKKWVYNPNVEVDSTLIATDKDELFSYVKKYSPSRALEQLFSIESQFGNCHDNAHYVGRFSYELYDSEAFRQCAMLCQSGCYHGAVEAYFREHGTSNLADNINKLCSGNTNPFIVHQCRHGVGHGLLAWSDYALFDALEDCNLLQQGEAQTSCYSGVFMENIVQSMASFLEIEGHTTQYLSDDPHYPCNIVDAQYKPTCYFLQTDRMVELSGGNFATVAQNCSEVEDVFSRRMCFESMGRTVGGRNRNNPPGAISTCYNANPGTDRLGCLMGAVQDTFWDPSGQDNAISFCKLLTPEDEKDTCYGMIFGRAPQVLTKEADHRAFCQKAETTYQGRCLAYIR
ncbi:MAG: hypothetical protein O2794_01045 [bacterium]|nr:hypothetical protein [bacterium]